MSDKSNEYCGNSSQIEETKEINSSKKRDAKSIMKASQDSMMNQEL